MSFINFQEEARRGLQKPRKSFSSLFAKQFLKDKFTPDLEFCSWKLFTECSHGTRVNVYFRPFDREHRHWIDNSSPLCHVLQSATLESHLSIVYFRTFTAIALQLRNFPKFRCKLIHVNFPNRHINDTPRNCTHNRIVQFVNNKIRALEMCSRECLIRTTSVTHGLFRNYYSSALTPSRNW